MPTEKGNPRNGKRNRKRGIFCLYPIDHRGSFETTKVVLVSSFLRYMFQSSIGHISARSPSQISDRL